ncbi:MAG TPA: nucleotidyltransferase family protein [Sphingobium sp.]|uniref:nucleotidyltransferase family protein n=1 Tax=Sphingobium sp. TaxID=1912891 RepID=UPI002ED0BBCA
MTSSPDIPVAILAAGRASRFGGGKLDAICAGKPLGRWVLEAAAAAGLSPGFLIVGPQPPAFAEEALYDGWSLITNPHPEEGLGTSVALAAAHADCLRVDALVLLLADMPLTSVETIRALLDHMPLTAPVATRYRSGRPGVPARFPASLFGALAGLHGDRGASTLLRARPDLHLLDPPLDSLLDVDDADDLARAEALLSATKPPAHRP